MFRMKIYNTIISRRTIRKFRQKPIELSVLKRMVNAGRLAPTAGNIQPLEYIVVVEDELRERIFPNVRWAQYIAPEGNPKKNEQPAAYIIILVNREIYLTSYYRYDVGASAQNITLTALEVGIGCCWIGSFNRKEVKYILKVPNGYIVDLVLALGYPLENPQYYDIEKGKSTKYNKDTLGVLHIPKRKLDDIIHINFFKR